MKVLHILGYDEIKFNLPLVQMLSNEDLGWEDEFYFATNNLNLYETINEYENTIFFEKALQLEIRLCILLLAVT